MGRNQVKPRKIYNPNPSRSKAQVKRKYIIYTLDDGYEIVENLREYAANMGQDHTCYYNTLGMRHRSVYGKLVAIYTKDVMEMVKIAIRIHQENPENLNPRELYNATEEMILWIREQSRDLRWIL